MKQTISILLASLFVPLILLAGEQQVLKMYYYRGLSHTEIGQVLNLSPSRICQVHNVAISKLRKEWHLPASESLE